MYGLTIIWTSCPSFAEKQKVGGVSENPPPSGKPPPLPYDSTTGYLQLRLIGQSLTYIKVELLPQVKTRGCLLTDFKEKPAELAITSELAPPLPAYPSVMMSAKRCGLASLLLNIKGLTPEIH